MQHKSFYHLHTPKTGGRFIIWNVLDILKPYIRARGIYYHNDVTIEQAGAHSAWPDWIDDDTYVMSTFRDPTTAISSLFFHLVVLDQKYQIFPNPASFQPKLLNKKYFFNILETPGFVGSQLTNFQSKNFLYNRPFLNGPLDLDIDPEKQHDLLMSRVSRTNLLFKMEDIPKDPWVIAQKLVSDLDLDLTEERFREEYRIRQEHLEAVNPLFKVKETREFIDSFTPKELEKIKPYIAIDRGIYSTPNLFYVF